MLPTTTEIAEPIQAYGEDLGGTQPLGGEIADNGGTRPLSDDSLTTLPTGIAAVTGPHTRPLPRSRMFFEPLPERALLAEDRYKVRALIEETPMLNTYSAVSRRALVDCKQCGFARNNYGDQFCLQCGASLSNLEPQYPNYVIKETLAPDAIAAERRLAEMELHHGGALLPIETFNELVFGTRRVYVVLPEPSPFTATRLPSAPETTDVVNWACNWPMLWPICIKTTPPSARRSRSHCDRGKAARWFNFVAARVQTPGTRNRKVYADDVLTLAASLFVLLTGKAFTPDVVVSPPGLDRTFRNAFTGKITTASQFADQLRDVISEIRRPSSYDVRVGRLSDVGHVRQINEDSLLSMEVGRVHRSIGTPRSVAAAGRWDGRPTCGDVTSGLAVNLIAQHAAETLLPANLDDQAENFDMAAWLREAVSLANKTVHEQRQLADGTNMGTTLVMAFIVAGRAHLANVGDSRAYLINQSGLKQLTVDHSLVQRLIKPNVHRRGSPAPIRSAMSSTRIWAIGPTSSRTSSRSICSRAINCCSAPMA